MESVIVSVIVPYLESSDRLTETLNSIKKQKKTNRLAMEIIVADAVGDASSKTASCKTCRIISADGAASFAAACNLGWTQAKGKYVVICSCGDSFDRSYIKSCVSALENNPDIAFAVGQRFCINPVFIEKKEYRLNKDIDEGIESGAVNSTGDYCIVDAETNPECINSNTSGVLYRAGIFDSHRFNESFDYESDDDFALRVLLDNPRYIYIPDVEFDYFMPLSDDFMYYIPTNYKEWYTHSLNTFLKTVASDSKKKYGEIPPFVQFYVMYVISTKFLANMNNRSKHNMDDAELEEFFKASRECLGFADDTFVLNKGNYKSLGLSKEAAEMFYMIKHDCTLWDMPLENLEAKNDIYLSCGNIYVSRLLNQRVGIHVMDYRNGNLVIDGSFRNVFNLKDFELYATFNDQKYPLEDVDRYSLTKYFGISAYKKFTFHMELPLDPECSVQTLSFYAKYRYTTVHLKLSFLHHWSKFTINPANSYWRFNKYVACLDNASDIVITHASALDTLKKELKFLPGVFAESKRSFITRIQYWLTRPFFKNKKIWLMYDKLYKGGDSCEYLYRYCADKKDGISRYYIIDKDTPDYKRLKKDGLKPVKNHSFKHKMLFLNTDIALITNSNVFPFNGYSMDRSRFIRGLCNFPSMCLQHGLSVQKCAMAQQRIVDNTQMYFLASKYEYKNLSNHAYNYQNFDILKMTGIGRYDGLVNEDKKQILLSPTWRMYNAMPVTTSEGEQRAYNPEFIHTTYYKIYNDLINNQKLIGTAKRTDYKILYVLHPILSAQVDDFTPDPYVTVVSSVGDFSYEKAFRESSLMVTDYSGVQFDFAYMKKPLVYFHPSQLPAHYDDGGFFYDTMGFGEICTESDELVDLLCEYMENGCKMKPKYVERVEDFYEFDDRNNCERIYNEILAYQRQVNKDKLK